MFEAGHVERVIRHLVRFGSSRADAEDLAQEALVIAWRKQADLDRDRSLDAWLYGIARNVYRNHARTLRRRAEEPVEPADAAAGDAVSDARELADAVALRAALHALPEHQQDIVILHELEEYTLKETAELLAIPFDTAKDRLRRAREVLRERMHVDLAVASTNERRAANQVAKLAAPAVLVGVLAAVSRTAVAGASAAVGAGASAAAGARASTGSSASTGASAAAASASSVTGALATSKVALGVALAIGIAVGVVGDRVALRTSERAAPAAAVEHAQVAPLQIATQAGDAGGAPPDATSVVASPAPQAPSPMPTPTPTPTPAATALAAATSTDTIPATANPEALLVERARVALRRGMADDAIRTLMSHERTFAGGQLAEERDVLLIEAYLAAGNLKLARQRLADYEAAYPAGLHGQRAASAAAEIARRTTR